MTMSMSMQDDRGSLCCVGVLFIVQSIVNIPFVLETVQSCPPAHCWSSADLGIK